MRLETRLNARPTSLENPARSRFLHEVETPWPAVLVAEAEALRALGEGAQGRLRRQVGGLPLVVLEETEAGEAGESLKERVGRLCGAERKAEREYLFRLKGEHDRMVRELSMAEQVQRSMLPRSLPSVAGAHFGAELRSCEHLAGDFYNAFRLDRDHVGFYVGDVMGHGAAAALLGVYTMQVIRTKRIEGNAYEILAPNVSLELLNRELIAGAFPGEPFVTMVYAVLNVPERRLTFSAAGHPPMWLLREGCEPTRLDTTGFVLGMVETSYRRHEVSLQPGDRVVMYSDGVEGVNWGDSGTGVEGLARLLSRRDGRAAQQVVQDAMTEAERLGGRLIDDTTVLMVELANE